MLKLLAVGLSVLQTAQAIPHHPGFFHQQDRFGAGFDQEADVSLNRLFAAPAAASVVFPETVKVCVQPS